MIRLKKDADIYFSLVTPDGTTTDPKQAANFLDEKEAGEWLRLHALYGAFLADLGFRMVRVVSKSSR